MSVKFKELLYERSVKGTETQKREPDPNKVTIFDIMTQIMTKKITHEYDKAAEKVASGWQLSAWFAHHKDLIEIVAKINRIQFSLTNKMVYDYYFNAIPKQKKRYIKWTKKNQTTVQKESEIENFMLENDLSRREALMILNHKERIIKNGSKI